MNCSRLVKIEFGMSNLVRIRGRIISVFDARKIASRPPASAGLVPAERQLICYRMTSAPPLSFPLAKRVGRRVGEGIFALAGSWPVVIPTGASPAEIGKHRNYFSLKPKTITTAILAWSARKMSRQGAEIAAELVSGYVPLRSLLRCEKP